MKTNSLQKKLSPDTITAIAATVVALLALSVSLWQGIISREHNRLSVKPHLDIAWIGDTTGNGGIRIDNAGIGPAEILKFEIIIDGKHNIDWDKESWETIIHELWPQQHGKRKPYYVLLRPGDVLKEGRVLYLLKFCSSDDGSFCPMKRLSVRIEYQSIYGERFQVKANASDHPYFQSCDESITFPSSGRIK
jgi:hypothetical protein